MPVYLIIDIAIIDQEVYGEYVEQVAGVVGRNMVAPTWSGAARC